MPDKIPSKDNTFTPNKKQKIEHSNTFFIPSTGVPRTQRAPINVELDPNFMSLFEPEGAPAPLNRNGK